MSEIKSNKRRSALFVVILLISILLAAAFTAMLARSIILPPVPPPETNAPSITDSPSTSTALPHQTTVEPQTTDQAPQTTTPPETTEPPPPIVTLPEAEPADDNYFSTILFIGDSRSQGMQIATGGYGATFYADRGLAIDGLDKKQFLKLTQPDGSTLDVSVIEMLTAVPFTGNIYIWFGLNEVGWPSVDRFAGAYRTSLTALRQACPDANICLMSVLPVARNAIVIGVDDAAAANARIRAYNDIIYRLAEEEGVYYLNCYEAFVDEEGFLPDGYASDGIHLLRAQNLALCDYIRTHPIP